MVFIIIFLFFLYVFHFLIGILVARTTIIGFFISIFYLCFNIKNKEKLLKLFFLVFTTIIIVFTSYSILDKELQTWINTFIFKYGESSVKSLIKMYERISLNLKTILIGDALWVTDSGYYMKIDVGYLRMIFFNGIVGLLFQILFNWNLTRVKNKELKKLSNILFVLYLILNLKGFISYLPICLLIYLISLFNIRNNKFKLLEKRNGEYINNNNSNSI